MVGNEWINGYLEAIIDSGGSAIDENKLMLMNLREREGISIQRNTLWRKSSQVSMRLFTGHGSKLLLPETQERRVRGLKTCAGAFGTLLARKKKQLEWEDFQRLANEDWRGKRDEGMSPMTCQEIYLKEKRETAWEKRFQLTAPRKNSNGNYQTWKPGQTITKKKSFTSFSFGNIMEEYS